MRNEMRISWPGPGNRRFLGAGSRAIVPLASGKLCNGRDLGNWKGDPAVWRGCKRVIVGASKSGNPRNEFRATWRGFKEGLVGHTVDPLVHCPYPVRTSLFFRLGPCAAVLLARFLSAAAASDAPIPPALRANSLVGDRIALGSPAVIA